MFVFQYAVKGKEDQDVHSQVVTTIACKDMIDNRLKFNKEQEVNAFWTSTTKSIGIETLDLAKIIVAQSNVKVGMVQEQAERCANALNSIYDSRMVKSELGEASMGDTWQGIFNLLTKEEDGIAKTFAKNPETFTKIVESIDKYTGDYSKRNGEENGERIGISLARTINCFDRNKSSFEKLSPEKIGEMADAITYLIENCKTTNKKGEESNFAPIVTDRIISGKTSKDAPIMAKFKENPMETAKKLHGLFSKIENKNNLNLIMDTNERFSGKYLEQEGAKLGEATEGISKIAGMQRDQSLFKCLENSGISDKFFENPKEYTEKITAAHDYFKSRDGEKISLGTIGEIAIDAMSKNMELVNLVLKNQPKACEAIGDFIMYCEGKRNTDDLNYLKITNKQNWTKQFFNKSGVNYLSENTMLGSAENTTPAMKAISDYVDGKINREQMNAEFDKVAIEIGSKIR